MVDLKSLLDSSKHKKDLKQIFTAKEGWVKIGWKAFHNRSSSESTELAEEAYDMMVKLGILSNLSKNNYALIGAGNVLNPKGRGFIGAYYFTEEEDAKSYKKIFFHNAQYTINLFKGR
jgi:hypothetical protein